MISPMGLEELRVCLFYQLANLQTLIVATKTNQILMDNSIREIAEIDLFIQGQALPNPTYNYFARLQGSQVNEIQIRKQVQSERNIVVSRMQSSLGDLCYSVISKKNRSKVPIQNLFQKSRQEIVEP